MTKQAHAHGNARAKRSRCVGWDRRPGGHPDQMGRAAAVARAKAANWDVRLWQGQDVAIGGAFVHGMRKRLHADDGCVRQQVVNVPMGRATACQVTANSSANPAAGTACIGISAGGKHDLTESTDGHASVRRQVHPQSVQTGRVGERAEMTICAHSVHFAVVRRGSYEPAATRFLGADVRHAHRDCRAMARTVDYRMARSACHRQRRIPCLGWTYRHSSEPSRV